MAMPILEHLLTKPELVRAYTPIWNTYG